MVKDRRIELNKYASSSFSGADIRVIANLNTGGLDKVKREIAELNNLISEAKAHKQDDLNELAGWENLLSVNQDATTTAEYEALKVQVEAAYADWMTQIGATTILKNELKAAIEAHQATQEQLQESISKAGRQHSFYLSCENDIFSAILLANPNMTAEEQAAIDYSACAHIQNDDYEASGGVDGASVNMAAAQTAIDNAKTDIAILNAAIETSEFGEAQWKELFEALRNQLRATFVQTINERQYFIDRCHSNIARLKENLATLSDAIKRWEKELAEFQRILTDSFVELGTLQTISCQAHRPKAAVRALGSTYARGYTRGPRTIAGSMIFTVINKQSLGHLCRLMSNMFNRKGNDILPSTILPDQLFPLDLTFVMANEYGAVSRMALYGVEFLNTGYTFSIEDLLLEEIVQFVARDIDPMSSLYDPQNHNKSRTDSLSDKPITGKETLLDYLSATKRTLDRRRF
jgi:hypothetical protein